MFNLVLLRVDATSGTLRKERFLTFPRKLSGASWVAVLSISGAWQPARRFVVAAESRTSRAPIAPDAPLLAAERLLPGWRYPCG
jgi:hypothetical protein